MLQIYWCFLRRFLKTMAFQAGLALAIIFLLVESRLVSSDLFLIVPLVALVVIAKSVLVETQGNLTWMLGLPVSRIRLWTYNYAYGFLKGLVALLIFAGSMVLVVKYDEPRTQAEIERSRALDQFYKDNPRPPSKTGDYITVFGTSMTPYFLFLALLLSAHLMSMPLPSAGGGAHLQGYFESQWDHHSRHYRTGFRAGCIGLLLILFFGIFMGATVERAYILFTVLMLVCGFLSAKASAFQNRLPAMTGRNLVHAYTALVILIVAVGWLTIEVKPLQPRAPASQEKAN